MARIEAARQNKAIKARQEIEGWCQDILRDNPELTEDEIYSDTVHAYLDAEVGRKDKKLRAEILRITGVGERSDLW